MATIELDKRARIVLADLSVNMAAGWFGLIVISPLVGTVASLPVLIVSLAFGIVSLRVSYNFRD